MGEKLTTDQAEAAGSPLAPASVLVVDDYPANLTAFAAVLEPLPIRVVKAQSGGEALRAVLEEEFAVILMDVQMPGMSGLETAALIRGCGRSRHTPIIFVSATQDDARVIARSYQQGAVDYLLKPFAPEILRSKVRVLVDLHNQAEQLRRQEERLRVHEREALQREGERRFRSLFDALPLSLWALETGGVISYSNRWWLDYAGLVSETDAPLWHLEPLHADDRAALEAACLRAFSSGESFEMQCRLRRASDGADRWHLVRAVPERSAQGAIAGWVVAAVDIDDQRRAAEAWLEREKEARRDAEERSRTKDQFLAVVSHELRTPLTGILGWTRVLRTDKRGAVRPAQALEAIERNARAQARLVDDLLDVTRMASGGLTLHVRRAELRDVISAALDAVRPTAEDKGIVLDVDLGAREVSLEGDPERLQQVCWNLLANSLKFTSSGGRVVVRVHEGEGVAVLSVQDDGQGIDPSFLPHLFEPFRQADMSMTRAHGGAGLGLSLVRHLVELHGGTVRADSPGRGKGTTFTVTLPTSPSRITAVVAELAQRRGPG